MENRFKVLLLFDRSEQYRSKYTISDVSFYLSNDAYNPKDIDAIILFHSKELKKIDLQRFSKLSLIKTITAGTDHIPIELRKKYMVKGTHGPNAKYIAEHALALTLSCARRVVYHTESMKRGEFHQTDILHKTLFDAKALILGFGPIGRYTAGLFKRAFGAHIYVYKKSRYIHHLYEKIVDKVTTDRNILKNLIKETHIVVNTLPLNEETMGLIDEEMFSNMREDVIIVNVSRGKVLKEKALFNFLNSHKNACAGIDVWYRYPEDKEDRFSQNYPFEKLNNIIMTPHNAPIVKGYFDNMIKGAMFQIKRDIEK